MNTRIVTNRTPAQQAAQAAVFGERPLLHGSQNRQTDHCGKVFLMVNRVHCAIFELVIYQ